MRTGSPGRQGAAWGAVGSARKIGHCIRRPAGTLSRSAVSRVTASESPIHSFDKGCIARSRRRLPGLR